jgi:hypothetical protein
MRYGGQYTNSFKLKLGYVCASCATVGGGNASGPNDIGNSLRNNQYCIVSEGVYQEEADHYAPGLTSWQRSFHAYQT